mgnify:CR=1 FL=1
MNLENYLFATQTEVDLIGKHEVLPMYIPREKFSHKGQFGHALIIGGSYGKIGAVTLASRAALSCGAGLVSAYVPKCGYNVLQSSFPEAMVITDVDDELITNIKLKEEPTVIGFGVGVGTATKTRHAFEAFLKSDMYTDNQAGVRVFTKKLTTSLILKEDSFKAPTAAKTVMAYELGERITQIITGRTDAFYSKALGRTDLGYAQDGVNTGALNGFSHGLWLRGFDKLPETESNKYKAFTTTFKDFADHNKAVWNLAVGIEKIGLKERIRIEPKSYFYNSNVTIHIGYKDENDNWVYPQVSNLERSVAKKHIFTTLELGYTKGWDNEEAMGLDEPNAKSTFTTPITNGSLKNIYKQISKYIAGSYPKEFIRRKPKTEFPTTDHSNDKEIFVHDLKRNGVGYDERKYQDDFAEKPTGIFSPETATNLRLSVVNNLLRHGWVIASTMIKEAGKYIRYGSSEGNSKMTTKLIGGKSYTENGTGNTSNIIVKEDLPRAKIYPETIKFEYQVDTEMIEQIEGSTVILGKTIPNFYGLVKFRNDEGNLETGFFWNLKPNDKGKWELLKAN